MLTGTSRHDTMMNRPVAWCALHVWYAAKVYFTCKSSGSQKRDFSKQFDFLPVSAFLVNACVVSDRHDIFFCYALNLVFLAFFLQAQKRTSNHVTNADCATTRKWKRLAHNVEKAKPIKGNCQHVACLKRGIQNSQFLDSCIGNKKHMRENDPSKDYSMIY